MKRVIFVLLVSMWFLTSCVGIKGNGNVVSQERVANGFYDITQNSLASVNVHLSEDYKVEVTTDDNLQDFIFVEVKDSVLYINTKDSINLRPTKLIVDVYLPKLQSIILNGIGNVTLSNGNASNLNISLVGIGSIDAQNYQVKNITIQNSGIGSAKIWATDSLKGTLSGIGKISYKGNPEVSINVSGIGKVNKL